MAKLGGRSLRRALIASLVALLAGMLVLVAANPAFRTELRIGWDLLLAGDPDPLRAWLLGFGVWAPLVSGVLQVVSSLIPFLPGFVLAIANAMLYGALWGGLLTFVTALIAAATCFGLARVLGRPGVERIVAPASLARVDRFMERRGMLAVFIGRLIPFINPDVLSYAAGATTMGWAAFLAAMAAGAVPATVFYSVVGGMAVESTAWVILLVFLAALLPLILLARFRDRLARWGGEGRGSPDERIGGSEDG